MGKVIALVDSIDMAERRLRLVVTGMGCSLDNTARFEHALQAQVKLNATWPKLDRYAVS